MTKRKASHFDEDYGVSPWASTSPMSDSSVCSRDSLDRMSVRPVPWALHPASMSSSTSSVNLRTRKRFRDNRPDVDVIHQNTLARLYSAQKAEKTSLTTSTAHPVSQIAKDIGTQHEDRRHESTQRSLHSFFNIRQAQPASIHPICIERDSLADNLELCAGCGNRLRNDGACHSIDKNMMEVDDGPGTLLDEEYECAACHRTVCDTCAVRGDQRICLECALPGTG